MAGQCPMTAAQIIDEYFIENRARLLDLAAFLDRLDRAGDGQLTGNDFRIRAFRQALRELVDEEPGRTQRVHMIFSDPTAEVREQLDRKAAYGAYNPALEVR